MNTRLHAIELHPTLVCNQLCSFCGLRSIERAGSIRDLIDGGAVTGEGAVRRDLAVKADSSLTAYLEQARPTTQQLVEFVHQAGHQGATMLNLSGGGEPLCEVERSAALLAAGRKAGMRTRVVTNGTLLDAACSSLIERAGLDCVAVSVCGPTPATHDEATGLPGAFARLSEGLSRLSTWRHPPVVEVHAPLTAEMLRGLAEMLVQCVALDADAVWLLPLKGEAPLPPVSPALIARAGALGLHHNLSTSGEDAWPGCHAAESQLVVHANGAVTPCCSMAWGSGELLSAGLGSILEGEWLRDLRSALRNGRCPRSCEGCPDRTGRHELRHLPVRKTTRAY